MVERGLGRGVLRIAPVNPSPFNRPRSSLLRLGRLLATSLRSLLAGLLQVLREGGLVPEVGARKANADEESLEDRRDITAI